MRGCLLLGVLLLPAKSVIAQSAGNEQPVLRIGPGVTPPRVKHKVEPVFSSESRADRIQGTVILQLVISPGELPTHIEVLVPLGYGLDQKAIEAVEQWTFEPAAKDGLPVPLRATIEVNFRWGGVGLDDKYEHRRVAFTLALAEVAREDARPQKHGGRLHAGIGKTGFSSRFVCGWDVVD
jgi:TonB family protein